MKLEAFTVMFSVPLLFRIAKLLSPLALKVELVTDAVPVSPLKKTPSSSTSLPLVVTSTLARVRPTTLVPRMPELSPLVMFTWVRLSAPVFSIRMPVPVMKVTAPSVSSLALIVPPESAAPVPVMVRPPPLVFDRRTG